MLYTKLTHRSFHLILELTFFIFHIYSLFLLIHWLLFVAFDVSDDTGCGIVEPPPGAPAADAAAEDEMVDETLFPVLAVVVLVVAMPSAP